MVLMLLATAAAADVSITVGNPSFEDYGVGGDNNWTTDGTGLTGYDWSISDTDEDVGVWDPIVGTDFDDIPDGNQVAYSWGPTISSDGLSEVVTAGRTYTLKVWVGESTVAFGGSTVQLVADGDVLAEEVVDENSGPGSGKWFEEVVTYAVQAGNTYIGDSLVIRLGTTTSSETAFDKVSLTYVPEPGAMALLALGGVGLLLRRRTRR